MIGFFVFLFSFILFLFCFYSLSHDDFLLLRRNITLEQVFNTLFEGLIIAFLISRVTFILLNAKWHYFNPVTFLLFPYFPGFSLAGGIIGGIFFLFWISDRKKMLTLRFLDICMISFLFSLVFSTLAFALYNVLFQRHTQILFLIEPIIFLASSTWLTFVFNKNRWKDGVIGSLILFTFSATTLIGDSIVARRFSPFFIKEDIAVSAIFLFSAALFFSLHKIFLKGRRS